MTKELELFYFDIPGRAEAIRMLCKHAGLDLKDTRLTREQFLEMRKSGVLPFNQLPCLLTQGQYIAQSGAILRFIGKISGMIA
jgi:glutathione S-transferase